LDDEGSAATGRLSGRASVWGHAAEADEHRGDLPPSKFFKTVTLTQNLPLSAEKPRAGSVCLNSSWAFPKCIPALVRPPSGLIAARSSLRSVAEAVLQMLMEADVKGLIGAG
jgi:hypothetical protein